MCSVGFIPWVKVKFVHIQGQRVKFPFAWNAKGGCVCKWNNNVHKNCVDFEPSDGYFNEI